MRILLPPSETKNSGGRGTPIGRRSRSTAIEVPRQRALDSLTRLLDEPRAAMSALLLPQSVADDALADNAAIMTARTVAALQRYSGVVYDGLAFAELSPSARRLATHSVLIFSGLFGVVRGGDPIPPYRVPAKAQLPGLGIAGTFWRSQLKHFVPPLLDNELIIDLRSGDYAAMWQPDPGGPHARRLMAVRVLSVKQDGSLAVISYNSKLAKGKLAAALLERRAAGQSVTSLEDIDAAWRGIGGQCIDSPTGRGATTVDLIA